MRRQLGILTTRRAVVFAGLNVNAGKALLEFTHVQTRAASQPLPMALTEALRHVPAEWSAAEVTIAISSADLACADCFQVPFRNEREISEVSQSLAESRCAGISSEDLAVDLTMLSTGKEGTTVEISAISQQLLSDIRKALTTSLPTVRLRTVCSVPAALAAAAPEQSGVTLFVLRPYGEAVALLFRDRVPVSWRSFPLDSPTDAERIETIAREMGVPAQEIRAYIVDGTSSSIPLKGGITVPVGVAPAAAAALLPTHVSNLLRGAPDAPRNAFVKLKRPLTLSALSAAGLMLMAGLWFGKQAEKARAELTSVQAAEKQLWTNLLPTEAYKEGALGTRMKQILVQHNKIVDANRFPSALAFWAEMASVFPNADTLGMTLDSMQLSPDGGRLSGRVKRGSTDPLSNAAVLEAALNKSRNLSARGEFETKENDIIVRMQLDYRSPQDQAQERAH